MKKLMYAGVLMGTIFLSLQGCRKTDPLQTSTTDDQSSFAARNRGCRLTRMTFSEDYYYDFHYNNRGLADQWNINYGDDLPDNYTFTYDIFGRLKTGHVAFNYSGTAYDMKFQNSGNRLTRETWYEPGTTTVFENIVNTYNFRGQLVKRESTVNNTYTTFSYDFLGNTPVLNYYVDGQLTIKGEYTYYRPNRNPYLGIKGITTGIPFFILNFTPWWETSEKLTVYDNGVPELIDDQDPAQTQMQTGPQFYLTSVTNFDRVTEESSTTSFEYENCGGEEAATQRIVPGNSKKSFHRNAKIQKLIARLMTPGKHDIKKELKLLKQD